MIKILISNNLRIYKIQKITKKLEIWINFYKVWKKFKIGIIMISTIVFLTKNL